MAYFAKDFKFFFIVSPKFHGTTLIGRMITAGSDIGYHGDGIVDCCIDGQICGCGAPVDECSLWLAGDALATAVRKHRGYNLWRGFQAGCSRLWGRCRGGGDIAPDFVDELQYLRFLAGSLTGDKMGYLDGQKSLKRVRLFRDHGFRIDGVIHVKRDLLPFLGSCRRGGDSLLKIPLRMLEYFIFHILAQRFERSSPYISVRYEAFCDQPQAEIDRIRDWMSIDRLDVDQIVGALREDRSHFLGNAAAYRIDGVRRPKKVGLCNVIRSV